MTTMKSLEKRLTQIPEPDLERYEREKRCNFLRQFPLERLCAFRKLLRDAEIDGRTLTLGEVAAVLGIPTAAIEAASNAKLSDGPSSDGDMTAISPPTNVGTEGSSTKPNRKKKTTKAAPPNDSIAATPKEAASFLPPAKEEADRFYAQFSFEQRLAVRQLCHELAKAGRPIITRAELCAAMGISMIELNMRLAKARHPAIPPDTAIPVTSPATKLEAKASPTKPKEKKTNKGSRPTDDRAAAPRRDLSRSRRPIDSP